MFILMILAFAGLGIVCYDNYKKDIAEEKTIEEPDWAKVDTMLEENISPESKVKEMIRLLDKIWLEGYESCQKGHKPHLIQFPRELKKILNWEVKDLTNDLDKEQNEDKIQVLREQRYWVLNLLKELDLNREMKS
jgi:hypothetical protein